MDVDQAAKDAQQQAGQAVAAPSKWAQMKADADAIDFAAWTGPGLAASVPVRPGAHPAGHTGDPAQITPIG